MQQFILKNLITIILILLFIFGFIKGFGEGFLKKILSFASLIITIIITKFLTPNVADILKNITNIEATLSDTIYNVFINSTAYDKFNLEGLAKIFNTGDIGDTIKNTLCVNIANALINLICGIFVFIVTLIIIRIVLKILDIIDYIPVVGKLNKFLGGCLGILEVVVILWIIFTIIKVLENVPQINAIIEHINESKLVNIIYNNNVVYNFLSNLFSVFKKTT